MFLEEMLDITVVVMHFVKPQGGFACFFLSLFDLHINVVWTTD